MFKKIKKRKMYYEGYIQGASDLLHILHEIRDIEDDKDDTFLGLNDFMMDKCIQAIINKAEESIDKGFLYYNEATGTLEVRDRL